MEKEFIPYQEALELKELGFDEPCLAYYDGDKTFYPMGTVIGPDTIHFGLFYPSIQKNASTVLVGSPLHQQAFKWFREKHKLYHHINPLTMYQSTMRGYFCEIKWVDYSHSLGRYELYEDAELACLKQMINILKSKQ
jgi:hypothetical protein